MSSKREQILAALATSLAATPSIGANVYRSRAAGALRAETPMVILEPLQDSASEPTIYYVDWQLITRLTILARGSIPDQVADPVVTAVYARMMADLTVGGLAYDVEPRGVTWQIGDADAESVEIMCDFVVKYRTALQDMTTGG